MEENWQPIEGYEGFYEVSDWGRIRRLAGSPHCSHTRLVKPWKSGQGYLAVTLSKNDVDTKYHVAHLVLGVFLGKRSLGKKLDDWQVNHKDGDKCNNSFLNLEYLTHRENKAHAKVHGFTPRGEKNHAAKLTEVQVIAIRKVPGMKRASLSQQYGVSLGAIDLIRAGKTWKHVVDSVVQ